MGNSCGMILSVAIALVMFLPLTCDGQVYNVDPELRQVYEHFTGKSLSDEVRRADSLSGNLDTLRAMAEPPARNCYWHPPEGSGIVSLPDIPEPPLTTEQFEHHRSIMLLGSGVRVFQVFLRYKGDIGDLSAICINTLRLRADRTEGEVVAMFPIEKLVDIVRHPNVTRVRQGCQYRKLN